MENPSKAEFSPCSPWKAKHNIHTRVYSTTFEKGTERVCTIIPCKDNTFSFSVVEMNADLSLVATIGTSKGRGYSNSLTGVMTICDRLAGKVFARGRQQKVQQLEIRL